MTARTTTRKPAASKTAPAEIEADVVDEVELSDELFDNYDPEGEDDLIEALAKEMTPRYLIVEKSLAARFPDGFKLKVSLDVPYEKLEEFGEGGATPAEQLEKLLTFLGQKSDQEQLRKKGAIAVIAFAERYFGVWQKIAGATLGESGSSSAS